MGIRGVTVSDVRGFGSQGGLKERHAGMCIFGLIKYLYSSVIPCFPCNSCISCLLSVASYEKCLVFNPCNMQVLNLLKTCLFQKLRWR